jgi:outer membrane lipoprotein-sorting protein
MKKALILTFCALIIFSTAVYGMAVKKIVDEMNARYNAIIEKSSGIRITQVIKSMTEDAELTFNQVITKKGKKYKIVTTSSIELEDKKTRNVIIFDGSDVWFISPFAGVTLLPRDEAMVQGMFDDFSKLIPIESSLMEDEEVGGEECYVIKTPEKGNEPFKKIWISKTRFIPLKAWGKYGDDDIVLTFSNYKKVKGIWGIPYETVTKMNDVKVSKTTVKNVELNLDIDEGVFGTQY